MNFDPRTKAKEEAEENERKLDIYAHACAALDLVANGDFENETVNNAFTEIWNMAMCLESAIEFYRRIDRVEI
jgi:hypothetical protein